LLKLAAYDPHRDYGAIAAQPYVLACLEQLGEPVDWTELVRDSLSKRLGSYDERFLTALVETKPKLAADHLRKRLESIGTVEQRRLDLAAVTQLGDTSFLPMLRKAAFGIDPMEAAPAVHAIALLPGKDAQDLLAECLDAPTTAARRAALEGLALRPRPELRGKIETLLNDRSAWTGVAALSALSALPRPKQPWDTGRESRLPALLYALWTSKAALENPDAVEKKVRDMKRAAEGQRLFTGRLVEHEQYGVPNELEAALHRFAGEAGVRRWRSIGSYSIHQMLLMARVGEMEARSLQFITSHSFNRNHSARNQLLWIEFAYRIVELTGKPGILEHVVALLDSPYPIVRQTAAAQLRAVANGSYGYHPDAPRRERLAQALNWLKWIRQAKPLPIQAPTEDHPNDLF
jgi:hypothetical protein